MRTLIITTMALIMSLLASCSSTSIREVRLAAMRLDSSHLVILAHVRSDDSIDLPMYLHTEIGVWAKRTQSDTLNVLFVYEDYEQVWLTPPLDVAISNHLERAESRAHRPEYYRLLALIEGHNTDVGYLRMNLLGVDEDIIMRVGDYKVIYPKRIAVSEVFIGGYAK